MATNDMNVILRKKVNRKRFCKRHYPVSFTLNRVGVVIATKVIPWVIVVAGCALAASIVVELITKGSTK